MITSTTKQSIPPCFERKMQLDELRREPVVSIQLARAIQRTRRECQFYFLGPAGGGTDGGGSPVAMVA